MKSMYKHDDNTIDPRDTNLVTYAADSKKFIVEASMLRAMGITPESHLYTIGGHRFVIHLWSEKFQTYICYRSMKSKKSPDGETIADVFAPYFGILTGGNSTKAYMASMGTELHILND